MNMKSFVAGMGTGAVILVVGMALAGAAQAPATKGGAVKAPALPAEATFQELTTQVLNVVNKKGDIVAKVQSSTAGGEVVIFSDAGQPVAVLKVQGSGGAFAIADRNQSERVRLTADGVVEVLGSGTDEVMARMAAFKVEGSSKSATGRSDFSGQFSAYQKSGVLVTQLPK